MIALLYNFLLLLALPGVVLFYLVRQLRRGRVREGWPERFGRLPADLVERCRGKRVIWVHAVSVGETMAAKPLVAALRERSPEAVILLSQVTETGRETARGAGADGLFYLPVDLPPVVDRVLRQLRPALLVTIDTELWPNLFWVARRRGVKVAVANGRISDRSLSRIRRFRAGWVYRWTLSQADLLLMQSELDAGRAAALGAPAGRVRVTGNLKGDEAYPAVDAERLAWWRATLGLDPAAPVLLAGSTGPGEEAVLIEAFATVRAAFPAARLVLVPRAVDRADEIAELVTAAGLHPVRRSALPAAAAESRARGAVVIVDTIGELSELYAVATVAFVGRSLVKLGGSNVLQAAAQGKPTLSGPYVNNVRDSVALLAGAAVLATVTDAVSLAREAVRLFGDAGECAAIAARAQGVVAANRGATARTAAALLELLDE